MSDTLDVLVVDDEQKICRLLADILTARGCAVRVAFDGLDGLSQFQKQPADIVITDLKMPKLTGLELLRELKRIDPLLNVVVITAYPSIEGAVEAMKDGASDFITKPFDIVQIQAFLYRAKQRLALIRQVRTSSEGLIKLEELNRRLTELNDLKSQFLTALSHEINTPLCLMSEWIYLLLDGTLGPLSPDQQHALEVLIGAYERLFQLLQQLIDLMHGHEVVLRCQHADMRELLQQAVDELEPKAAPRSIRLTVQVPDEPLPVEIDRVRCLTALSCLIDNAIKFNRDGGRVAIEMKHTPDRVEIRIQDSGIGIPAEEHEKIFTPFYQVEHGPNRLYEGAGIGLTLAKRYIELHNGSLALESVVGAGTTITVRLPRKAAPALAKSHSRSADA